MPMTRFSLRAEMALDDHTDAEQALIISVETAIDDRVICDTETRKIRKSIDGVVSTRRPGTGYMVWQDQMSRTIQLIANTGGMTDWVDEQLRSMTVDRTIVPAMPAPDGGARTAD